MSIRSMFDDPINFFKKKQSLNKGIFYVLISFLIFCIMNQVMIYIGFVSFNLKVTPISAILINFSSLAGGYFLITALCYIPFVMMGGKKLSQIFTVTSYSLIPIALAWVPHIIPQAILFIITMILM